MGEKKNISQQQKQRSLDTMFVSCSKKKKKGNVTSTPRARIQDRFSWRGRGAVEIFVTRKLKIHNCIIILLIILYSTKYNTHNNVYTL